MLFMNYNFFQYEVTATAITTRTILIIIAIVMILIMIITRKKTQNAYLHQGNKVTDTIKEKIIRRIISKPSLSQVHWLHP